jgi:glycosyltransferase involved in cell wall biosynthesis
MKKILMVTSQNESTWGSCRVISPNLQQAYSSLADDFKFESFILAQKPFVNNIPGSKDEFRELADTIMASSPDYLCFPEHLPVPSSILKKLKMFMNAKDIPPVIIHIYGDFTYFSHEWTLLNEIMMDHPIKFITASASQQRLINFFLNKENGQDYVEKYLFPVNEKEYFFDPQERKLMREELGISDDEKIILYAGRISLQKNVDVLIKEFRQIVSVSKFPVRLWIAGGFDDIGATFMGIKHHDGFMFSKIQKVLDSLPEEVRNKIHFWGQLTKQKLRKVKAASDMFMSFSLYHDEDYGKSPAEALATGLPALLTDWGGYSSFTSPAWNCRLVPVEITSFGHKLETSVIEEFYNSVCDMNVTDHDRKKRANEFIKEFSINGSSHKLRSILNSEIKPFKGFNWGLNHFSRIYWSRGIGKEINKDLNPSDDNFYFHVYQNYISLKRKQEKA